MNVETREQYRNLIDALSVGDHVGEETHANMVAFAKAKKMKLPPADNPAPAKPAKKTAAKKAGAVAREIRKAGTCSEKGCDRTATALGLCKRHHTAQWRKDPANLEKTRVAARKHNAKKRLTELAAKIGPGFHPNTKGDAYTSLPDGLTAERVDQIVDDARSYDLDVYAITLGAGTAAS